MLNIFKYYKERLKSLLYYFIIFNFYPMIILGILLLILLLFNFELIEVS